jgi:hypothetical protein
MGRVCRGEELEERCGEALGREQLESIPRGAATVAHESTGQEDLPNPRPLGFAQPELRKRDGAKLARQTDLAERCSALGQRRSR